MTLLGTQMASPRKDVFTMYIGVGTIILILLVVIAFMMMRRSRI